MLNHALDIHRGYATDKHSRLVLPMGLLALFILDANIRGLLLSALADAYVNVGVFVAATLFVYYVLEQQFGFDISQLKQAHPLKMLSVSALLGALPGCGGAIIVVSQYAAGHLPFAAVVTVLVATMGDAAFLLLAADPKTGLLVITTGLVVGILSGVIVWLTHPPEFLSRTPTTQANTGCTNLQKIPRSQVLLWSGLLIATLPLTLASAFQIDVPTISLRDQQLDLPLALGASAATLGILMWALLPLQTSYKGLVAEDTVAQQTDNSSANSTTPHGLHGVMRRVIHDTNFIMVWVALAFAAFELAVHYTGLSLEGLFIGAGALAPLIGVLIGFLPGCGPQIIVAMLYLQGVAPLSTLLGNAISNDGDALFPAIALTPKAAILATLYSAIPAVLIAYAVHFWAG